MLSQNFAANLMKVNNRNVHMLFKELMFNQGSSKYLVNKIIIMKGK